MLHNNRVPYSVFVVIAVLLCVVVPVAGLVGINAFNNTAPATTAPLATKPSPTAAVTPTPAPVCSGPTSMSILLIGSDTRVDNYSAGLADAVRVIKVDFVHPNVMSLTFQRDLYVEIPGIASHAGITHGKLNQAYLYGNSGFGYYEGPGQGPGLLAATLQQNFGVHVDHYVAINSATFVQIVDTLGGIDVNLPSAIDGRVKGSSDPNRFFRAGQQHLDGYRSMLLARLRPNGDLARSDVQNLILKALAARILAPGSLPQMPRVVEAFYRSVQTDLNAHDIARLLCLGALLNQDNIVSVDFPPELFTPGRVRDPVLGYTFVWDVDFDVLRAYVQYFNEGTWPATPLATP